MRGIAGRWAVVVFGAFASFHCSGSAPPARPAVDSRGSARLATSGGGTNGAAGAAGASGAGSGAGGTSWSDEAGATEEPIPPCTAMAACCATLGTNELQGYCQEELVADSPQECANAVVSLGCAPE